MRNGEGEEEEEEGRRGGGGGRRRREENRIENAPVDKENAIMETEMETEGLPTKENSSQMQRPTAEGATGEVVSAPVSFQHVLPICLLIHLWSSERKVLAMPVHPVRVSLLYPKLRSEGALCLRFAVLSLYQLL